MEEIRLRQLLCLIFSLCLVSSSLVSYAAILPATSLGGRSASAMAVSGYSIPFVPIAAAAANVTATSNNTGFADSQYVAGLNNGTSMVFAPDGRLFVTLQNGDLRVVKNGTLLDRPFLHVNVKCVIGTLQTYLCRHAHAGQSKPHGQQKGD